MNKRWLTWAAAATVLAFALGGVMYNAEVGLGGSAATPSPTSSRSLIARGTFRPLEWDRSEFEAFREDGRVVGRMTIRAYPADQGSVTVELECARTLEDGVIMIGGHAAGGEGISSTVWARDGVAIALKPASPVQVGFWMGPIIQTVPETPSGGDCLAYLDAWLYRESPTMLSAGQWYETQPGFIEFGPSNGVETLPEAPAAVDDDGNDSRPPAPTKGGRPTA